MATFVFMLQPETQMLLLSRVLHQLQAKFPEHEFVVGEADFEEYENSIIALYGGQGGGNEATVMLPDHAEVTRVQHVFEDILKSAREWKPS